MRTYLIKDVFTLTCLHLGRIYLKNKTKISFSGYDIHFRNFFSLLYQIKEIFVLKVYNVQLETKSPTIIDCGSNIGLSTIYFKRKYPKAKIYCYEPSLRSFTMLKKNVKNLCNVILSNYAVGKTSTTGKLYNNSVCGLEDSLLQKNTESFERIKIAPFHKDIQTVDLLKIDCEGYEREILESICFNVQSLVLEAHYEQYSKAEILRSIKALGLTILKTKSMEKNREIIYAKKP